MLSIDNTVLALIDVQEKLANLMFEREQLIENLTRVIKGTQILGIPVIWNEQYPKGLGATIAEIAELLPQLQPLEKTAFSCCGNEKFLARLEKLRRRQVALIGIETHVCVYQTAADLLERDYHVEIVADAVSSRTIDNKQIGLEKMKMLGAHLTSTETILFELLKSAGSDQFREISQLVK